MCSDLLTASTAAATAGSTTQVTDTSQCCEGASSDGDAISSGSRCASSLPASRGCASSETVGATTRRKTARAKNVSEETDGAVWQKQREANKSKKQRSGGATAQVGVGLGGGGSGGDGGGGGGGGAPGSSSSSSSSTTTTTTTTTSLSSISQPTGSTGPFSSFSPSSSSSFDPTALLSLLERALDRDGGLGRNGGGGGLGGVVSGNGGGGGLPTDTLVEGHTAGYGWPTMTTEAQLADLNPREQIIFKRYLCMF